MSLMYIYSYAFGRGFYPKWLVHSRHACYHSLGAEPKIYGVINSTACVQEPTPASFNDFYYQIHTFWALADLSSWSVGQHNHVTKYSGFWETKGQLLSDHVGALIYTQRQIKLITDDCLCVFCITSTKKNIIVLWTFFLDIYHSITVVFFLK